MTANILCVDDDPNGLNGLLRILRKEPYQLLTAQSAEEASHMLREHPVDLIVSDDQMPGMSGTEFLARVAANYPDTVRIVLTGNPTVENTLRSINEGKVYQFFTKPCNEIDLAITIRRALEQKDLTDRSRDLLDVTKRQSALIDEARLARRLFAGSHTERAEVLAKGDRPADPRELIEEMDAAVRKGRELLREVREPAAPSTA